MKNNPFKEGSTSHNDFKILSDLKWHCTKCELKSGQAKTWQVWRQRGIQIDTAENGKLYKSIFCKECQSKTVHRKLKSLEMSPETKIRSGLPVKLSNRIKEILNFEEALFLRKMEPRELEVDHKFPQVRWGKDESQNDPAMSISEIKAKFILLTRSNNLLKSRYCEKCFKTGNRGNFPGVYYWYESGKEWDKKIDKYDEEGCKGCFWYSPHKWREGLNGIVNK